MPSPRIRRLQLKPLHIPFTRSFRHASAERSETATIWGDVELDGGARGSGESCPRSYVTGESLDTAQEFLSRHRAAIVERVHDVASMREWMASCAADIDAHPAAWCAIELALLDAFAKDSSQTIEQLLGLPPLAGTFRYTAVLGDAEPAVFKTMIDEYRRFGFTDFKVKLSGDLERDRRKLSSLHSPAADPIRLRFDANNLWPVAEEAISFLRALAYPLFAIEEPIAPNQYEALAHLGDELGCSVVLDESLLRAGQLESLPGPMSRWIVNVRVSKMGGLLRSLEIVRAVRRAGGRVVVGAQVGETSLLTRAALTVASNAEAALVAQEGAFGTKLLVRDVSDPPLMFGHGGVLDTAAFPALREPGFGII